MAVREHGGGVRVRPYRIAALCGALGVLSGYAAFLYYRELYNDPESCPGRIALALLIAAAISYAIEWLREIIREGKVENSRHPLVRTMGTFVVVLLFELFIAGFHAASEAFNLKIARDLTDKIVGASNNQSGAMLSLGLSAGTWVVVGAAMARRLSREVRPPQSTLRVEVWRSCRNGLKAGLVVAPLAMLGYLLVSRSILAFQNLVYRYDSWTAVIGALAQARIVKLLTGGAFFQLLTRAALAPMALLSISSHHGAWWFLATFATLLLAPLGIFALLPEKRKSVLWHLPEFFAFGCIAGTVVPFAIAVWLALWPVIKPLLPLGSQPSLHLAVPAVLPRVSLHPFQISPYAETGWATWAILEAMLLAVVIWAVPGALFGVLVPLLRRQAQRPRNWAFIGYASAALMIVASMVTQQAWPLIPAAIAALAGVLFHRGIPIEEYWPFAALCVALGVCGATSIEQRLTFAGVASSLHTLDAVPAAPIPAAYVIPTDTELQQKRLEEQKASEAEAAAEEEERGRKLVKYNTDPEIAAALGGPCNNEALRSLAAYWGWFGFAGNRDTSSTSDITQLRPGFGDQLRQHRDRRQQELRACIAAHAATQQPQPVAREGLSAAPPANGTLREEKTPCLPSHSPMNERQAAQALEIAITGSVGFWITVGLLACWSIHDHKSREEAQVEAPAETES